VETSSSLNDLKNQISTGFWLGFPVFPVLAKPISAGFISDNGFSNLD
jgi:hypothetical protein